MKPPRAPRAQRASNPPMPPLAPSPPVVARDARIAAEVEALARVMREFDLHEIEVEHDGDHVRLKREPPREARRALAPEHRPIAATPSSTPPSPAVANAVSASEPGHPSVYITAPFVGTFYRQPAPGSSSFVEVGQHVRKGQVLCIIEAMKLMNEIEAEVDGTIVSVLAENGQPVEFGEPLFQLRQLQQLRP